MGLKLIVCLAVATIVFAAGALLETKEGKVEIDAVIDENEAYEEVSLIANETSAGKTEDAQNRLQAQGGKVEDAEYESLKMFVQETVKNWEEQRDQESANSSAALAKSTLYYAEHFKKEIKDAGLRKEFDSWKQIADDLCTSLETETNEAKVRELNKQFQKQMYIIVKKI
ncbi:hypothetical protein [Mesobacillus foraminis]|uniref:hypothetical protein n=1 Tax=Mesobacillus foraminis TaxID=279826 RepID=UPI000EF46789|nr:hypothetical protein [Mesobacillus foraminis]